MIDLETMRAKLRLESDGFDTGMASARKAIKGFNSALDGVSTKLTEVGEKMRAVGTKMTIGLTIPIVTGFGMAVKAASNLGEAQSATDKVFGESAKVMDKWAASGAKNFGMNKAEALTAANAFGVFGGSVAGLSASELPKFSQGLVQVAGDLGSFWNEDPTEMLLAVQAGLRGETEPLSKYGIMLNEASVAQRAMEMTGKASADQLTAGEKVLARQELILEGAEYAAGNYVDTSGELANMQRTLRKQIDNLAASFGKKLLPVVTKAVAFLSKMVEAAGKLSPKMQSVVTAGLMIVAAIGPAIWVVGAMTAGLAAMLSPIGLIVIAAGLLVAAFSSNFLGIRDKVMGVVDSIDHLWRYMKLAYGSGISVSQLVNFLPDPLKRVGRGFLLIADAVGDVVHAFQKGGFSGLLASLPGELSQIWQGLEILGGALWDKFAGLPWAEIGASVLSAAVTAFELIPWGDIWDGIKNLGSGLSEKFVGLPWGAAGGAALNAGKLAFQSIPWGTIWDGITNFFTGLWDKFQNYEYEGLGKLVGEGIRGAIELVGPTLLKVGGKIIRSIGDGLKGADWLEVLKWVALIPVAIPAAIIGAATVLVPKGKDFIKGLLEGLGLNWDQTVVPWLKDIPTKAKTAIGSLLETLKGHGNQLLQGLYDGAVEIWANFKAWLGNRKANAQLAVGSLIKTLSSHGKNLLQGLWDGAFDVWLKVSAWLGNIDQNILNAVGSLSGVLYGAGADVIWGFANGIWGEASRAISWAWDHVVSLMPGILKDYLKERSPSRHPAIVGAGKFVTMGFANGIVAGIPSVDRALGLVMDTVSGGMTPGYGSYSGMGIVGSGVGSSASTTIRMTFNINGYDKDKKELAREVFAEFNREMVLAVG